ncbi:MAG: HAMP domain-containing histidine kinase [Saccharothrix sp.]|nr:HAMP domain-containing histidine kinase [Saccharothrix sp.]
MIAVNMLLARAVDQKAGTLKAVSITPDPPPAPGPPQPGGLDPDAVDALRTTVKDYQWTVTWIAAGVLAVVGGVAGWWLAGRVLRPVHRITATAKRLSLSNLNERIALTGPHDELREIADTFDAMLDRLERAADNQRRFAANASHELRTPLAIQRAAIEIGLDAPSPEQLAGMRTELLEANLRTEQLIDGLMTLAQGEQGPETVEAVDLAELAAEAAEQHRPVAEQSGVHLVLDLAPAPTTGDPVMLTRLIGNLVHNAIRYNYPGGQVAVRTTRKASVTVGNTGPHVPADRIPELFEPFRRLHAPRTGTANGAGLGLSIVAAIAASHRATVDARPNDNGGLTIDVRCEPAADHCPVGALPGH